VWFATAEQIARYVKDASKSWDESAPACDPRSGSGGIHAGLRRCAALSRATSTKTPAARCQTAVWYQS